MQEVELAVKSKKVPNTSKRGRSQFKGTIEVEPVTGTRDFYPDDMKLRNWLFGKFRAASKIHCFEEYDGPMLELAELYKRKAGEEITKQMFNFDDKEGHEVTLRPEITPTFMRMVLKKIKTIKFPIKWFTIAQCWRFENLQLGRKREHYQWNADILGIKSVTCEAEILALIVRFFSSVGLSSNDLEIRVNSRKILQSVLERMGVESDKFVKVCVVLDKMEKLLPEQVQAEMALIGVQLDVIERVMAVMKKNFVQIKEFLGEDNDAVKEFELLWSTCEHYGISEWLVFDACTIRGLAYYTGVVFETFDRQGRFRAVCGGGRYDKLMELYGSKEAVPAVGFGMGDVVLTELLGHKGLLPGARCSVDDYVVAYDESLRNAACAVANKLRANGRRVDMQLAPCKKLSWSFDFANRLGAERLILVAPSEWQREAVKIKNLRLDADDPEKEQEVSFDLL